jgi:3-oxoacyl-[acyl-carrier-protein] synthase-3
MMDTSDAWIVERTGIRERHVGGTTADCRRSRAQAIAWPGSNPDEIDGLILATTTPDRTVPATASTVQHELGPVVRARSTSTPPVRAGSYALIAAHGMIAMGADKVLVIGTDTLAASSTGPTATPRSCSPTARAPS